MEAIAFCRWVCNYLSESPLICSLCFVHVLCWWAGEVSLPYIPSGSVPPGACLDEHARQDVEKHGQAAVTRCSSGYPGAVRGLECKKPQRQETDRDYPTT
eukprot:1495963-Amphidinium_carterae.2